MRRTSLIEQLPLALLAALLMGGAVAFFFLAMPVVLIEQGVIASGLPTIIAAAGPPLGATARALVAGGAAIATGGATWVAVTLGDKVFRPRRRAMPKRPVSRRADSHPDAPARRPIFASSDFGTPMEVEELSLVKEARVVETHEEVAAEWVEIAEPDAEDVLELVDVVVDRDASPPAIEEPSIASLMARLEAGAKRRAVKTARRPAPTLAPAPASGGELDSALRDALNELQRMAAR